MNSKYGKIFSLFVLITFCMNLHPSFNTLSGQVILGDVDGNGLVDIEDARLIARYIVHQIVSLPHPENADVTEDGKIAIDDALAIAQKVTGQSRIVIVIPEYGMPGEACVGSLMRIEVFERFFPYHITGGTVRIASQSTGYNCGDQPLCFERDGRSLYYHWDTRGITPSDDFEIYITLTGPGPQQNISNTSTKKVIYKSAQPEIVITLIPRFFEPYYLEEVQDAYAPALSNPLVFRRVFPQDAAHTPYLGPLGFGWMHPYDIHLDEFTNGRIAFLGSNGFNRWFMSQSDGTYIASPGDYAKLTRDPDGSFVLKEKNGFTYSFHPNHRLDFMEDPIGSRITAVYNKNDQLIEIKHSNGESFRLEYNEHGRISNLIDNTDRITRYLYTNNGSHLLNVITPDGRNTEYTYILGGSSFQDNRLISVDYPDGSFKSYVFDSQGRIATQQKFGNTIRFSYDKDGTTHITEAVGGVTTVRVNDQKRPIEVINPVGSTIQYGYDTNSNLIRITDPLSRVINLDYDNSANVTGLTDPMGNKYFLDYEPNYNKLIKLVESKGNLTSFSYDSRGNLASIIYPDGTSEEFTFTYDNEGFSRTKKNRDGQAIAYKYDNRGLLLSKTYPDNDVAIYNYDSRGNLISAQNKNSTIEFGYDAVDRILYSTYPGGRTFFYNYDADGRRIGMTDPDNKIFNYSYDTNGSLIKITDGTGSAIVEYEYDLANRRTRKTLGNGVYTTYSYDAAGQILQIDNYDPSGYIISYFHYMYEAAGNRLSKETIEGTEIYMYDNLDQLTSVTYADGSSEYFSYDPMGNRITATQNGEAISYFTNNLNQYTNVSDASYEYDANGNLISKTEAGQSTFYDYDFENQLFRVRTLDETIEYGYDPFGIRCFRRDNQGTIRYLRDGDQVAIEETEGYNTIARYAWGDMLDEVISMNRGDSSYYYTQDALLSVSDLMDENGNSVEHYKYRAFGESLASSSAGNPWFFTCLMYDFEIGLQYSRFRYYSPSLSRFIQLDPISLGFGSNLYSYCLNNPLIYTDPYGLWARYSTGTTDILGAGGGGGGMIGAPGYSSQGGQGGGGPGNPSGPGGSGGRGSSGGETNSGGNKSRSSPRSNRSLRGGVCPTFIQLPIEMESIISSTVYSNINKENLLGKIEVPISNCLLKSDLPIFGVAGGENFKEYRVEYGVGESPTQWYLIDSSSIPQPKNDIGIEEMKLMQGDIDIRGNLATWNTGLKNWVHLPWHPPEDTTDFNGIYTIRLLVESKDGQTLEDRVRGEVGRVIAQCLPGIAISPDKHVAMRFPEQSLTHPFRVFTIFPLTDIGEEAPSIPKKNKLCGKVYRIREPADRFAKEVSLEFNITKKELKRKKPEGAGIAQYDVAKKEWVWLPTEFDINNKDSIRFSTSILELPEPKAIYALLYDSQKQNRSTLNIPPKQDNIRLTPVRPDMLVENTFEKNMGYWQPRDHIVGASLSRDRTISPDTSVALKLTNDIYGGNFSSTVLDQPFDVRDYPIMTFDYRITPDVKIDFYLSVNDRWYNLNFTDDPNEFRNRDMNIGNIGGIEDVLADGEWHNASVNLYDYLRRKTRHTQIDAIIMADWNVEGYMKLGFGENARNATYYIDNFKIMVNSTFSSVDALFVDNFNQISDFNLLGGPSGVYSNAGTNFCKVTTIFKNDKNITHEMSRQNEGMLELQFDVTKEKSYCGYWTSLEETSLEDLDALSFKLKTPNDLLPMFVGLRYAGEWGKEAKVPIQPYLKVSENGGWQKVTIPLSAFRGYGLPDLSIIDVLFFAFENVIAGSKDTLFFDDINFHKKLHFEKVADFDRHSMEHNLLGGGFHELETEAAVISSSNHEDFDRTSESTTEAVRISYGGTIGLDYGGGRFSYAIWETDLLGFDAREYDYIILRMRGEKGGEIPNIYLDDGVTRRCIRGKYFAPLTTDWQEIRLPLYEFANQTIDLSKLAALQIGFEWEEMSGTIYISDIYFEKNQSKVSSHEFSN